MLLLVWLVSLASAKVLIFSPDALRAEFESRYHHGIIPSTLANFGNPPYGTVSVGRVFIPPQGQELGCSPLTRISFTDDPDSINTPILLLDRGECPFVVKARMAQDIGASAVIIVNDRDEDVEKIVMVDNGSGGNIFIPSYMINKKDGDIIKEFIKKERMGKHVAMTLVFDMKKESNTVHYSLWTSAENKKVYSFIEEFSEYALKFTKEKAVFTPHYVLWYCAICKEQNFTEAHRDCLSGGRYCAPDPDGAGPLAGKDVVMEDLRQICVFKMTEQQNDYKLWYDYMRVYNQDCAAGYINKDCSYSVLKKININTKDIEKCINESTLGQNVEIDDNSLLNEEKKAWNDYGVPFYPSLTVNNQTYRGDWEAQEVFIALCAGFSERQEECIIQKESEEVVEETTGVGTATVVMVLISCLILMGVVLFLYRLWIRREMKDEMRMQVNNAVSQYFALSEQGGRGLADRPLVKASFQ